jgi:organic radical activating enzyme
MDTTIEGDFSVLLNFPSKENSLKFFGCTRNCHYCNWKTTVDFNSYLFDFEKFQEILNIVSASTITISGGGDPLFEHESSHRILMKIVDMIRSSNKKIRLITREVDTLASNYELLLKIDYLSISFDSKSYKQFLKRRISFKNFLASNRIEFSVVLPPEKNVQNFIDIIESSFKLPMVFRENSNSIFKIEPFSLSTRSINKIVLNKTCTSGKYFDGKRLYNGTIKFESLADTVDKILNLPNTVIIGGVAYQHLKGGFPFEPSDIDVVYEVEDIVLDNQTYYSLLLERLKTDFPDHNFELSTFDKKEKALYIKAKPKNRIGKPLHIIIVESKEVFLSNRQLDVFSIYIEKSSNVIEVKEFVEGSKENFLNGNFKVVNKELIDRSSYAFGFWLKKCQKYNRAFPTSISFAEEA